MASAINNSLALFFLAVICMPVNAYTIVNRSNNTAYYNVNGGDILDIASGASVNITVAGTLTLGTRNGNTFILSKSGYLKGISYINPQSDSLDTRSSASYMYFNSLENYYDINDNYVDVFLTDKEIQSVFYDSARRIAGYFTFPVNPYGG